MKIFPVFIIFAIIVSSCASTDTKVSDRPGEEASSYEDTFLTAKGGELTFDPKLYVKKKYDASKNGEADIINVFKKVPKKDGSREEYDLQIHVKMMDLNRDGKIDVWRFYDNNGAVAKEEIDLDFDGKIDVTNFYTAGVVRRKEFSVRFDEKTDRWKHYDENGVIILLEEDQCNNGKPDYWEHYTNGVLERIEKDTSGDGKPDVFQRTGDKGFTKIMSTTDKFDSKASIDKEFSKKAEKPSGKPTEEEPTEEEPTKEEPTKEEPTEEPTEEINSEKTEE